MDLPADLLVWLVGAAVLAGLVRGFSGFGTGLVFMPVALILLDPAAALLGLVLLDLAGGATNLRGALRLGDPVALVPMVAGMLAGLVPGLALLLILPGDVLRWMVAVIALAAVVALGSGWRWRGGQGPALRAATGFVSGVLGGSTGLSGPPVMLFWLSVPGTAARTRANAFLYFMAGSIALLSGLALTGQVRVSILAMAALMIVPFLAANWLGGRLFAAGVARFGDRLYRNAALVIIAASALAGLPVWR